jgi:2-oxoglutarate/2-oxoacid ferredoxin oxidoreductase subunit alpha
LKCNTLLPYKRDEKLVRPWAVPGTPGLEHRIGGLEKQDVTGNVSYDPDNHQHMVLTRQAKIDKIADYIPEQHINVGAASGDILLLGWGSTFGVITNVVTDLVEQGKSVSHAHLRYIRPFPRNLGTMLKQFKKVLIPEINNGQLEKIIKADFSGIEVHTYNKIKGVPIYVEELKNWVESFF